MLSERLNRDIDKNYSAYHEEYSLPRCAPDKSREGPDLRYTKTLIVQ